MIVDLEGDTTEPSRRTHVVVLSAAAAAVSLALLIALFVPAPRSNTPPVAASAAPSPASMTVFFRSDSKGEISLGVPGGATWIGTDRGGPFEESLRDDVMTTVCATAVGANQPVLHVVLRSGQPIAAYTSGTTGRFIPLPKAYVGSGWLTVPCDTSDVFAPRLNRAR